MTGIKQNLRLNSFVETSHREMWENLEDTELGGLIEKQVQNTASTEPDTVERTRKEILKILRVYFLDKKSAWPTSLHEAEKYY